MATFRLVEFEFVPFEDGGFIHEGVRGVKQIINIFECEGSRERLLRFARKHGVKVRGNKLIEIEELSPNYRFEG